MSDASPALLLLVKEPAQSPWTWARVALLTPLHGSGVLEQLLIPGKHLGMVPVRGTG